MTLQLAGFVISETLYDKTPTGPILGAVKLKSNKCYGEDDGHCQLLEKLDNFLAFTHSQGDLFN